jgi:hypothetical protein
MDTISLQTNNSVEHAFHEELKEAQMKRLNRFLFVLSIFVGSTLLLAIYTLTPLFNLIR